MPVWTVGRRRGSMEPAPPAQVAVIQVQPLQSMLQGRYRFERELGRGGMATVWIAHDLRHDRPVALKVLRPDIAAAVGADRFLREIRLTARLQHPNILPVLDSGAAAGERGADLLWYTMPLVEGETLRSRLARERQLPVPDALGIVREVADALDCAHRHGIVHRDVKPENILLGGGHALLADFGIAKMVAGEPSDTREVTSAGLALGTPAYMSPEQAVGDPAVDARTDVYALGCVLYEMLAGEPPYSGPTAQAIVAHRLADPVPSVRRLRESVSSSTEAALSRAMAKVPADRFATAGGFAAAVAEGPGRETAPPPQRRVGWWRLAAAAGALGLIAATLWLRRPMSSASSDGAPTRLAVLPFKALGVAGDSGVLTVGIPDAIITRLAGVHQLRLRPTSAVLRYQAADTDPQTAARELGVDYVLAGTVQSAADRLRVSVQLLRAADGGALWGAHYDLSPRDLLTLQDSIAERVSGALAVRMNAVEQERLFRRYTDNVAAYEAYLRGRSELARVSEDGTRAAIAAFERALALDSTYALARAGLAMASADMHLRFATGAEVKPWGERAEREAARALELDPGLAEAHLARAAVARKADFNWALTLEESRKALELNPNLDLARYFRAAAFYHLGLLDRSEQELRQVDGVDSQNRAEQLRTTGVVALLQGRNADAVRYLEEARHTSSRAYTDSYLSQAYFYAGDTLRAFQILDSLKASTSTPAAMRARASLASFSAFRGDRTGAEGLIGEITGSGYMDHHVAYSLGVAYVQLDRLEEARTWLDRAATSGFPCYPWYVRDELLEPFRRDSSGRAFLERLRAQWEAAKTRYD
jgi:eukaryotic-like serine/threonine-protein kinase